MGDLPTDQTQLEYPFLHTGMDYAGPVLIANRKGRGSNKTLVEEVQSTNTTYMLSLPQTKRLLILVLTN